MVTCLTGLDGLVVRDLTLAHGNTSFYGPTDGAGAGLAARNGDVVLENCIMRDNVTGWKNEGGGAGAYLVGGTALVRGCVFRDNRAIEGGSGDSGGPALVVRADRERDLAVLQIFAQENGAPLPNSFRLRPAPLASIE